MFNIINRIILNIPTSLILVFSLVSISLLIYSVPVLDRDEARYAQTSFQISQTNDFINLTFEETSRLKKPPGIYWAQFASYQILKNFFDKEIWMFRIPSFISLLILLFFTHKLGRLLFYDLNTIIPLTALTGTIIIIFESIQATTDMAYAAFSLISYYFFIKSSKENKNSSALFFIFSSLIAMIIKGPIFLILILIVYIFQLIDTNLSINKKLKQLSNISIVILSSLTLGILYNIFTNGEFFEQSLIKDFSAKLITAQESHSGLFGYYFLGSFLIAFPIYPLFIIGIFYNLFKKINWDKYLIMILSSIFIFIFLLEIIPTKLPHYILPVVPLMAIYLSRTLEFTEFKLTKLLLGLNIILPLGLMILDFKSYEYTGDSRSNYSYIYYSLMVLPIILNPVFYYRNNASLANIVKLTSLSSSFLVLITFLNLVYFHKNIWIADGIHSFIQNNYDCGDDYSVNIDGINEPSLVFNFYEKFNTTSNCNIIISSTDFKEMPIENIESTNMPFFNYSNGKKINLNFLKK